MTFAVNLKIDKTTLSHWYNLILAIFNKISKTLLEVHCKIVKKYCLQN